MKLMEPLVVKYQTDSMRHTERDVTKLNETNQAAPLKQTQQYFIAIINNVHLFTYKLIVFCLQPKKGCLVSLWSVY